ncbi:MAG: GNAT family N-acetyltransferase [Eubacteriales bacterium]|nr:GNAT family N-acetyltransferase [Eubacteriales bacterium]MDD4323776.1 GNAT family N-acetyltransferase [Eubacteriales bacterium]MDD4540956.1 GNAT family N-acetyltransferase [Eubacteriales bacterium]
MEVKHEAGIFYIGSDKDSYQAKVTYHFFRDDVIIVDETKTKEEFRGQGLARKVVISLIDWARKEGMKILPECPYASKVMRENDDYRDMIYSYGQDKADTAEQ